MEEIQDLMFVSSGRTVIAVDRFNGRAVWRRKLPRFRGGFLTILATEREVYAGRGGYVYCFDVQTGEPLWERGLKAGGGMVMMTMGGQSMTDMAAVAGAQAQQAAAVAGAAAASAAAASG